MANEMYNFGQFGMGCTQPKYPPYQGYQAYPQPPQNLYQPAPTSNANASNIIYVVSVEDAVNRISAPNTKMNYVLQDESMLIQVFTDQQGKKFPSLFDIVPHKDKKDETESSGISIQSISDRLTLLEGRFDGFNTALSKFTPQDTIPLTEPISKPKRTSNKEIANE